MLPARKAALINTRPEPEENNIGPTGRSHYRRQAEKRPTVATQTHTQTQLEKAAPAADWINRLGRSSPAERNKTQKSRLRRQNEFCFSPQDVMKPKYGHEKAATGAASADKRDACFYILQVRNELQAGRNRLNNGCGGIFSACIM